MDDGGPKNIKSRVRLALRAERAMGLSTLPIRLRGAGTDIPRDAPVAPAADVAPERATPPATAPAARPVPAAKPPQPARKPAKTAVNLFGAATASDFVMPSDPFTSAVLPTDGKTVALQTLDATYVKGCTRCRLHESRTHTVFGEGDVDAQIMFVGEGPGENEDLTGRPFVGKAGQLLDKMILAMGLTRQRVYIANVVKCRPPNNRQPAADETATCTPYLVQQIETVRPKVIVTLGLPATQFLLQSTLPMGKLRGQWQAWRGIDVMPTYHPAYVLRSYTRQVREAVWSDLLLVLDRLKLPRPGPRAE
ncbi:MAG TPA: uracil-DNA glycosylase [Tepidisphaeraceae bacterium]